MAITTHISADGAAVTISIDGRFVFNVHKEFRQAYEQGKASTAFVLDLQKAEYLDSSALGMLLILREYAGGDRADITLRHCNADIAMILRTANFHQLFTMV